MPIVATLHIFLRLAGLAMLSLAFFHIYLYRALQWSVDLKKLKPINEQIFWAHTAFLVVGIILLGLCCLIVPSALTERTVLGKVASGCFFTCWLSRLIFQFVLFKGEIVEPANLERLLRLGGSLLWITFTLIFAALFAYQLGVIGS